MHQIIIRSTGVPNTDRRDECPKESEDDNGTKVSEEIFLHLVKNQLGIKEQDFVTHLLKLIS
jgi:hypothetical protein